MEALFVKLLDMSIAASYIVLAVIILRLVFRSAPKWIHCMMWALVAFRLLCPFSIESDLSIMPAENVVRQSIENSYSSEESRTEFMQNPANESVPNEGLANTAEKEEKEMTQTDSANTVWKTPKRSTVGDVVHYSAYVWSAGLIIILIYCISLCVILYRRVAEAIPLRENIYQCDKVESPFLLGIIKPKIYLPFGMSETNMQYVIAHEQAHIHRRDNLTKVFAFVLTAVYWFNPVMWIAYALFCRDMELACDESVIRGKSTEERKAYSMALLECSAEKFGRKIFSVYNVSPIAFGEIGVKKRVINVFKNKKSAIWVVCAAVIVCAAAAILLLTNPADDSVKVSEKLDSAVSNAILDCNKDLYIRGEVAGEGHYILDVEQDDKSVRVYVLCSYGEYIFMNGNLVMNSGCSAVPTVITFDIDENGDYIYKSYTQAQDGSLYMDSVKEIFPSDSDLVKKAVKYDSEIINDLSKQCHNYAKEYLREIGRNAEVGEYADFDFKYLSDDYGVSAVVSNSFLEFFPEYDIYVGNFESVENSVRYVYEISWDGDKNGNGIVEFRKYEYNSGETIEDYRYQVSGDSFTKLEGSKPKYYEDTDNDGNTIYVADDGNTYKYKLAFQKVYDGEGGGILTYEVLTDNPDLTDYDVIEYYASSRTYDKPPCYEVSRNIETVD